MADLVNSWIILQSEEFSTLVTIGWVQVPFGIRKWMTYTVEQVRAIVDWYIRTLAWEGFDGEVLIKPWTPRLRWNIRSLVLFAMNNERGWFDILVELSERELW